MALLFREKHWTLEIIDGGGFIEREYILSFRNIPSRRIVLNLSECMRGGEVH